MTSPFLVAYILKKSLTDLCRVILYHLYQTYWSVYTQASLWHFASHVNHTGGGVKTSQGFSNTLMSHFCDRNQTNRNINPVNRGVITWLITHSCREVTTIVKPRDTKAQNFPDSNFLRAKSFWATRAILYLMTSLKSACSLLPRFFCLWKAGSGETGRYCWLCTVAKKIFWHFFFSCKMSNTVRQDSESMAWSSLRVSCSLTINCKQLSLLWRLLLTVEGYQEGEQIIFKVWISCPGV